MAEDLDPTMAIDEDLNNDQGFVRKPYARRKLIRNPDGTTRVAYVDIRTGKEVNPKGYQVIEADNTVDTTQTGTQTQTGQNVNTPTGVNPQDPSVAESMIKHTNESASDPNSTVSGNTMSQYGYTNKPAAMGFAGMLPGPLGLAGKLANVGVNVANTQAVNEQRAALGMDPNSTAKNIGSGLFDQKGYIGDVSQKAPDGTTNTTPVGFEATDKYNRTTYTPEEARRHEILAGAAPATEEEKQNAIGSFQGQFPEQGSFFSKLQETGKNFMNNIFGGPTQNGSTNAGSTNGGYPDAPTNTGGNVDNSPDDRDQKTANVPGTTDGKGGVDTSHFSPGLW